MIMNANPYGIDPQIGWTTTTLGELAGGDGSTIQTGPFGSQLHARDYKPVGTPVVMPQQLGDNTITLEGIARISDEDRDRLSRHILEEGDIVFSRRGDVTRRAYIGAKQAGWFCGTGCLLIRVKSPECDNRFLSLFFSLPQFKDYIKQKAVGSTMPNLNQGILQRIPIVLPSLTAQSRIVDVLSAYDDLIENNRRRMELLEASARHLYEEWFVRLRFPGHEHTPIKHGIPKGWEKVNLKDVCKDKTGIQTGPFGSQLHQSDYVEEGNPVVMPKNILGSRIDTGDIARVPDEITNRLSKHKLVSGDIVLARRGDIGRKSLVTAREEGWLCGTGCMRLRPKQDLVTPRLLFETLGRDEVRGELIARAGGSIMPNLNLSILSAIEFVNPPHPLQVAFSELMHPWHEQISNLDQQNEKLKTARDHLLPRLMSGEVPV